MRNLKLIVLLFLVLLVGCAGQKDLMRGAENTGASKTVAALPELSAAPDYYNLLFIDDDGVSKKITARNLMRLLESAQTIDIVAANLADVMTKGGATCILDDGDGAIDVGTQCTFEVPYKHDLSYIKLTTDETSGSITIDVWVDEPGGTTGLSAVTDADSLFDTATEPVISNAGSDRFYQATSFDSGEAANIPAGSYYTINVDACSTITRAVVSLGFTKKD